MKHILFLLILFLQITLQAQPPRKFYTRIGGKGYDYAYDVKQTLDGGYVIAGSTSSFGLGNTDVYLLKIDSMGQINFQTAYGGYNNESAKSVIQLADESYVMAGYTSSKGFGGYDIYVVKTDKFGTLLWEKTFGGTDWDFCNSLQATTDGGFIIAGSTTSFGYGNMDGYIIKIDGNGIEQWHKNFGGKKNDEFKSIVQTQDGGYAIAGQTKSYNDSLGDAWVFKLDINGDSLWSKYYGGNKEEYLNQIIDNSNGDLYVVGATKTFGLGKFDGYGIRLDNLGNELTSSVIGGSASDDEIYNSITFSKRSPTIISIIEKEQFTGYGTQTKILELDFNFNYINATDYGSTKTDELFKIVATKDSGYVMVGYTEGFNASLSDIYVVKCHTELHNVVSIVSVNELSTKTEFNLYPNPVKEIITLKLNKSEKNKVEIISHLGESVFTTEFNEPTIQLDVSVLMEGIYFIKINNSVKKFIKQ